MINDLMLEYRPNNTGHRDLHFRIVEYECIADSYYLALDAEDDGPGGRIETVLILLLQQWIHAVQGAGAEETVFLPFDFSDQNTRCLRCRMNEEHVEVQPGWSCWEGWRVVPRNPGRYFHDVEDFHPELPRPILLARAEFLLCIKQSIAQAQAQLRAS